MSDQPVLIEYFSSEIGKLDADVPVETRIYVATLLARFADSRHLFRTADGKADLEPLAFMLERALEEPHPGRRVQILKHMGDVALFQSGFFSDSIERRGLDVDYYIQMGGRAYTSVSSLAKNQVGRRFGQLYQSLAQYFTRLVRMLWDLADSWQMGAKGSLLELYQRWEKTQSERLERRLVKAGFLLQPGGSKQSLVC